MRLAKRSAAEYKMSTYRGYAAKIIWYLRDNEMDGQRAFELLMNDTHMQGLTWIAAGLHSVPASDRDAWPVVWGIVEEEIGTRR